MTTIKNWILDAQNILGLIFIVASGVSMTIFGHDVFGTLVLTDKLSVPYAALPMAFGFLILKTDIANNINALRGRTDVIKSLPPQNPGQ